MSLVVSGRLDASGVTHVKLAASLMSPEPLYAACAGYAQIGRWRTTLPSSIREAMIRGVEEFAADVRERRYPEPDHGYTMAPDEAARLTSLLAGA